MSETALFVAIRAETRSRPTKRRIRSTQRHIHTILRTTLLNTTRNCSNSINTPTLCTPNRVKQPTKIKQNTKYIPFDPYFTVKDILEFAITIIAVAVLTLKEPHILIDPDNFTPANPSVTPAHIQPEWHFLFA